MSAYTGTQYKSIGNATNKFTGTFDGNNFKIINLTYTSPSTVNYVGLFGYSSSPMIQNLHLENVSISSGGRYIGGIIGCMGGGKIVNCSVTGIVTGYSYTGGLIGQTSGDVEGCHTNCSVTGSGATTFEGTGGIVGAQTSGIITHCSSNGTVTGYAFLGGIAGEQEGIINQSYNQSAVNSIGTNTGNSPSWAIGGITGFQMGGSIKDCYNTGNINGYSEVGGIIGRGIMQNCYSTGIITGQLETGGLSGLDIGTVNSYWDVETSGIASSGGGKGRTTEQMKLATTYLGWNHEEMVWTLTEGEDYPHLAWEGVPGDYLPVHDLMEYVPGNGDEWEPYRINSAEQLNTIGLFPDEWGKNFVLENDIDLSNIAGIEFNKIGTGLLAFSGAFDGQGYTISYFTYHTTGSELFLGMFGYAYGATIKNINLRDVNISSNGNGVGGLVGAIEGNNASIENCSVTGNITGGGYVGGLIGGGASIVKNCYSDCCISGKTVIGGLAGSTYGDISNCYSLGSVTAVGDAVEELVNGQAGQIAGGLAGLQGDGLIRVSFSNAAVTGRSMLGGLVGAQAQRWDYGYDNNAFISNCYAVGNVIGDDGSVYIGGLAGYQNIEFGNATILDSYSAGQVTAGTNSNFLGGFIGYCGEAVFNSFWDVEASGLIEGAGNSSNVELAGKTTAEMKTRSTFTSAGWDFLGETQNGTEDVWAINSNINGGYPYLLQKSLTQGNGSIENPYQISTAEEMIIIGTDTSFWDKSFVLMANIDMSAYKGTDYSIIGTDINYPYTGTFDGNGYKISNLTYTTTDEFSYVGLFGFTVNATIKNLGIENINISARCGYTGGLVGWQDSGNITHCYCTGTITTTSSPFYLDSYVGGLVGYQSSGKITSCYSTGSIASSNDCVFVAGGLVGEQPFGSITNCYSTSSITYSNNSFFCAGGLVGEQGSGIVTNCYSTGGISGNGDTNYIGGLAGFGNHIINSFWDIQSSGLDHSSGGIGKTTAEMKTLSSFTGAGWDFADVWALCEGTNYPRLLWQIPSWDFACPDGVGVEDLDYFVEWWLSSDCMSDNNYCGGADVNSSGGVDLADWAVFAGHWLEM